MEKLPNDMDYLAERGYEEVPGAKHDVAGIKKNWHKKHGAGKAPSTLFYLGLTTLLLLMAMVGWLFKNKVPAVSKTTPYDTLTQQMPTLQLEEVVALPEKFVKPSAPVALHPSAPNAGTPEQSSDTLQVEILSPRNSEPDRNAEKGNDHIGFAFNSNVYYIQQLKVSNYYELYFKGRKAIALGGTPADANSSGTANSSPALKQEAPIYLHEELARALRLFREGSYAECQALLLQVAPYNKNDVNCNFYLGMCAYYRHTYSVAIEYLDQCLASPNNTFWEEAAYYQAMSWKESGEEDKAQVAFKKINKAGGFYAARAAEQLSEH